MESTRATREAIVQEHMDSEIRHDFEATIATFARPRYEIVPEDEVLDGVEALRAFYAETDRGFPDFRFENTRMYHCDDAVIVETDFVGTHRGTWRGLPRLRC